MEDLVFHSGRFSEVFGCPNPAAPKRSRRILPPPPARNHLTHFLKTSSSEMRPASRRISIRRSSQPTESILGVGVTVVGRLLPQLARQLDLPSLLG